MAFAADGAATPTPQPLRHSPSAATMFDGGSRVALAYGTSAANRATATMIVNATQPGNARIAASASGAPSSARTPAPRATPPAAMATGTTGTIARLAAGEIRASRPNVARTTGSVAACAARDTPRLSASQLGTRPPPNRPIRSPTGVAQAMRPAVARDDSWNPASAISDGSASSSSTTAQPSAAAARPARPDSRASRTTPAMAAARTTDGDAPEKQT